MTGYESKRAAAQDKLDDDDTQVYQDHDDALTIAYQSGYYDGKKAAQPAQKPMAWVDLQKEAQQIVESKFLWKRFIDGTPLSNDIACWMANFAQQHTAPPQRPWVGLTDEEIALIDWESLTTKKACVRAIEAKLKEKNT